MSGGVLPLSARITAALVNAAPLAGLALYAWAWNATQNMLVFFFPGAFMVIAGLVAALAARLLARPGFVRRQAGGSLRFHGILAVIAILVLIPLPFWLEHPGFGYPQFAVVLFVAVFPLVELARVLVYGIGALRATPPPLPEG